MMNVPQSTAAAVDRVAVSREHLLRIFQSSKYVIGLGTQLHRSCMDAQRDLRELHQYIHSLDSHLEELSFLLRGIRDDVQRQAAARPISTAQRTRRVVTTRIVGQQPIPTTNGHGQQQQSQQSQQHTDEIDTDEDCVSEIPPPPPYVPSAFQAVSPTRRDA